MRSVFIRVLAFAFALLAVNCAIAAEPASTESMTLTFDRPCTLPAQQAPGPGVVNPRMSPKYPPQSPKRPEDAKPEERGLVEMLLLVNEEGYVAQAKLLKSSGSPALDRASLRASSEWRLEPGKVDGKSTCMWMVFFFTWQ